MAITFMMLAPNNRKAFSLTELAVVMAVTGLLLSSATLLLDATGKFFSRMRVSQLYALHIDPIQSLLRTQVRNCRYAVYADRGNALVGDPANRVPVGAAVRCERLDGKGWFLLCWDNGARTLWVEPGIGTGGSTVGPAIPFCSSLSACSFDVSQGFLQASCRLPVPQSPYFRSDGTGEISYVLFVESDI